MGLKEFLESRGCVGKDNAMPRVDVASWLGVSVRELKHLAEEERGQGAWICYSTDVKRGGLYLAGTEQEKRDFLGKLQRQHSWISRQVKALERTLEAEGQATLF